MFSFVRHLGHQYVHTFHFLCALELGFDLMHRFPGSISWLAEFFYFFIFLSWRGWPQREVKITRIYHRNLLILMEYGELTSSSSVNELTQHKLFMHVALIEISIGSSMCVLKNSQIMKQDTKGGLDKLIELLNK